MDEISEGGCASAGAAEGWKLGPGTWHIYEMGEELHELSGGRGTTRDIDCLGIPWGGGEFLEKGQPYLMLQRHSHQGEGTGLDK